MARVACRGQVQPVTVQSKAVRSRETVRSVDFGISDCPLLISQNQKNPHLNDYVEAAIMLDYNNRDVAAAWY